MKKKIGLILMILLVFAFTGCNAQDSIRIEDKEGSIEETVEDSAEKQIGRIITHEDFLAEIPKRVDLGNYDVEFTDYGNILKYVYTSEKDCEIKQSKKNFQVEIDGITVTLPSTVNEFVDLGFELISMNGGINAPEDLSVTETSALFEVMTLRGNTFQIYAVSKENTATPLKDLIVMQISCDFYEGNVKYGEGERYDAPNINFFGNINGKSTVDSILKELKTPQGIYFTQSLYNGKTTLVDLQLDFDFLNQKYKGSIVITTHTVLDENIKQTSYVTSISYRIDYESIKNN